MKMVWSLWALMLIVVAGGYFVAGVRVIIVPDMPALDKARAMLIVANAHKLKPIERPDQFCASRGHPNDDWCEAGALAGMMQGATLLTRF